AEQMAKAFEKSALIRVPPIPARRDPPDTYRIDYLINSLHRDSKGKPIPRGEHTVEIQLTSDYPRLAPQCKMLTPIFHPNIDETTICRSEKHTSELQSLAYLVCRLLLEKKKNNEKKVRRH